MEDDFYATIKFKNGEEIFAKVAASEEEDRTMLILSNPVMATEVKAKGGLVGYKVEPWLKTTKEDMFIINMSDVLTISESSDVHMISMFQQFVQDSDKMRKGEPKLSRKMGYISNVNDAKDILEKLYKSNNNNKKS
jgi:hypothetical protein|tara:strand:+ start:157 stop:564 length:408 start_codon:yes stop_codon:yes gene_type:complete